MIFVTVGTQLPFDRLIWAVDDWAAAHPGEEVVCQIGPEPAGKPRHCRFADFYTPQEMDDFFSRAELIVGHAGMGTILGSLRVRVPIVVVPRREALGEHRSDHQVVTANWLQAELGLEVVHDVADLAKVLDRRHSVKLGRPIAPTAQPQLISAIRDFALSQPGEPSALSGMSACLDGFRRMVRAQRS